MPGWELRGDVLAFAGLRVRLQRIGIGHWRANTTLRSWGAAPLHRDGDGLLVPCGTGEALWIGAWLDDGDETETPAPANADADVAADAAAATPTVAACASVAAAHAAITVHEPGTGHAATLTLPPGFQLSGLPDADNQAHPFTLAAGGHARDLLLHLRAGNAHADCPLRLCAPQAWAAAAGRPAPAALTGPPPLPPRLG